LLRGLVEANYPSLLLVVEVEWTGISFDLFLWIESRLYLLADKMFHGHLSTVIKWVRESDELYGHECDGCCKPFASPTSGTSATAIPNATGHFSEPM
jgi:hypothetical protein